MSKEQFKKSISDLIFHYIRNMVFYEEQMTGGNELIKEMIKRQASALNGSFNVALDEVIDLFIGEESESQILGE